jgi:hypothetical protein
MQANHNILCAASFLVLFLRRDSDRSMNAATTPSQTERPIRHPYSEYFFAAQAEKLPARMRVFP